MPFDPAFLDLMSSVAQYFPLLSRDVYGQPTVNLDGGLLIPCHVTYTNHITRTKSDEETVVTAQIIIPAPGYVWIPTFPNWFNQLWQKNGQIASRTLIPVTIPQVATDDIIQLYAPMPGDGGERKVVDVTLHTDEGTSIGLNLLPNPTYDNTVNAQFINNISHQSISLT